MCVFPANIIGIYADDLHEPVGDDMAAALKKILKRLYDTLEEINERINQ